MARETISKDRQAKDTHDLDQRIAELVSQVRTAQENIDSLNMEIEQAKDELRALLQERGGNWSDDVGYARLTSEGVRTIYDTKALDELIIKDPLHYGWLKDYRNESTVRSTVQVK
jgi:uncharacterized protein YdcH (DUF465 family)